MLDFISRNFSFEIKAWFYQYKSAAPPHLEYTVQLWAPHHAKDIAKLQAVKRRATKIFTSLRNKSCEERLARLNFFSLEKTASRKVIECFKILSGFTNVDVCKMFSINYTSQTMNNGGKLRWKQVQLDWTKFVFTNDAVREWDKLPPSVKQCDTINLFKNRIDHHFLNQDIR